MCVQLAVTDEQVLFVDMLSISVISICEYKIYLNILICGALKIPFELIEFEVYWPPTESGNPQNQSSAQ